MTTADNHNRPFINRLRPTYSPVRTGIAHARPATRALHRPSDAGFSRKPASGMPLRHPSRSNAMSGRRPGGGTGTVAPDAIAARHALPAGNLSLARTRALARARDTI